MLQATNGGNSLTMHHQWATRPDDERMASIQDVIDRCEAQDRASVVVPVPDGRLIVRAKDTNGHGIAIGQGTITLASKPEKPGAELTHWSFGQVCGFAQAPAGYLRTLPADLAAQNLAHGLGERANAGRALSVLVGSDGQSDALRVRAITSPGYARIPTTRIARQLQALQADHPTWKAPMVYPRGNFGGVKSACVGYVGDRDAYLCLLDTEHRIADPTDRTGEGLARGIMVQNSEVGAKRFEITLFLCRMICGNFIIWGMKTVAAVKMRHFGETVARTWPRALGQTFGDYANAPAGEETQRIQAAANKSLGPGKPEVLDLLTSRGLTSLVQAEAAYALAERYEPDPRSAWGIVQGLTRLSQASPFADARIDADRAAAKVLALV